MDCALNQKSFGQYMKINNVDMENLCNCGINCKCHTEFDNYKIYGVEYDLMSDFIEK